MVGSEILPTHLHHPKDYSLFGRLDFQGILAFSAFENPGSRLPLPGFPTASVVVDAREGGSCAGEVGSTSTQGQTSDFTT